MSGREKEPESSYRNYYRIQMQKEMILKKLRAMGCRITKQRITILEIILAGNCSSCKEIYYMASAVDSSIGAATVYRMVNLLEEIGAISRKKQYEISCWPEGETDAACTVELSDHSVKHLSGEILHSVLQEGLRACGYLDGEKVVAVSMENRELIPT